MERRIAGEPQRELSLIGRENVTRTVGELKLWFNREGRNEVQNTLLPKQLLQFFSKQSLEVISYLIAHSLLALRFLAN